LNVSSPGVERSLSMQRQYPRHVGKSIRVVHRMGDEEFTSVGTLEAAGSEAVSLLLPKTEEPLTIPYTSILEARVELPW
ncbi:MAG: ribosome maturation factor RimP, partial [Rubricoccaceae bacterium]|nr:ribosome maturation factor RimP [Rubricoccaceae bacterium]